MQLAPEREGKADRRIHMRAGDRTKDQDQDYEDRAS
jgi:hypothetical protein